MKCPLIELTKGKHAIVSPEDFESVSRYSWHCTSKGYAARGIPTKNGRTRIQYMHRFIMEIENGEVDHINGNSLDNRRENLRIVSHSENMMNQRKKHVSSSKYKGVYWYEPNKSWIVQIKRDGKPRRITGITSEYVASVVYDLLAIDSFGKFASLNHEDSKVFSSIRAIRRKLKAEYERGRFHNARL